MYFSNGHEILYKEMFSNETDVIEWARENAVNLASRLDNRLKLIYFGRNKLSFDDPQSVNDVVTMGKLTNECYDLVDKIKETHQSLFGNIQQTPFSTEDELSKVFDYYERIGYGMENIAHFITLSNGRIMTVIKEDAQNPNKVHADNLLKEKVFSQYLDRINGQVDSKTALCYFNAISILRAKN